MENMITYLDGVACTRFKAILLHREITPVTINNYNEWIEGSLSPVELKKASYSYSKITLKYFVEGESEKETLLNISNLIKAHTSALLKFSDLNLKYNVKLESQTTNQIKDKYYELTIVLKSDFKLDQEKCITLNESKSIPCTSNVDTPARLIISSDVDCPDLIISINDDIIKIPSLKANDIIIVDGIDYLIKLNDIVNVNVVDLWSFPILKSGNNDITINKEKITLKIEYTERYI